MNQTHSAVVSLCYFNELRKFRGTLMGIAGKSYWYLNVAISQHILRQACFTSVYNRPLTGLWWFAFFANLSKPTIHNINLRHELLRILDKGFLLCSFFVLQWHYVSQVNQLTVTKVKGVTKVLQMLKKFFIESLFKTHSPMTVELTFYMNVSYYFTYSLPNKSRANLVSQLQQKSNYSHSDKPSTWCVGVLFIRPSWEIEMEWKFITNYSYTKKIWTRGYVQAFPEEILF